MSHAAIDPVLGTIVTTFLTVGGLRVAGRALQPLLSRVTRKSAQEELMDFFRAEIGRCREDIDEQEIRHQQQLEAQEVRFEKHLSTVRESVEQWRREHDDCQRKLAGQQETIGELRRQVSNLERLAGVQRE